MERSELETRESTTFKNPAARRVEKMLQTEIQTEKPLTEAPLISVPMESRVEQAYSKIQQSTVQEAGFLKVVDSLVSSSECSELLTLERSPQSSLEHSQLDCWECSQLVCWKCSLLDCWECSQLDCWEC